ncbi:MAG: hypothetical protein AAGE05_10315 [Pseudomonadota bacterium]
MAERESFPLFTAPDPVLEREVLDLLEEALNQPPSVRRDWLSKNLRQRIEIGGRVEQLLAIADRYGL